MDRGRREVDEGASLPACLHTLNGPDQGSLFQQYQSVINASVSVFPKVPKDEGASGADGDQETC